MILKSNSSHASANRSRHSSRYNHRHNQHGTPQPVVAPTSQSADAQDVMPQPVHIKRRTTYLYHMFALPHDPQAVVPPPSAQNAPQTAPWVASPNWVASPTRVFPSNTNAQSSQQAAPGTWTYVPGAEFTKRGPRSTGTPLCAPQHQGA